MTIERQHQLLVELHEASRKAAVAVSLIKSAVDDLALAIYRQMLAKHRDTIRALVAELDADEDAPAGKVARC